MESIEPVGDETHYHEVGELADRIFDALADCGI
jgi:hypothetical protein